MGLGLVKHGSSFRDINFVAKDLLKLTYAIKACLI